MFAPAPSVDRVERKTQNYEKERDNRKLKIVHNIKLCFDFLNKNAVKLK
jgi:hypothetical protein